MQQDIGARLNAGGIGEDTSQSTRVWLTGKLKCDLIREHNCKKDPTALTTSVTATHGYFLICNAVLFQMHRAYEFYGFMNAMNWVFVATFPPCIQVAQSVTRLSTSQKLSFTQRGVWWTYRNTGSRTLASTHSPLWPLSVHLYCGNLLMRCYATSRQLYVCLLNNHKGRSYRWITDIKRIHVSKRSWSNNRGGLSLSCYSSPGSASQTQ